MTHSLLRRSPVWWILFLKKEPKNPDIEKTQNPYFKTLAGQSSKQRVSEFYNALENRLFPKKITNGNTARPPLLNVHPFRTFSRILYCGHFNNFSEFLTIGTRCSELM